MALKNEKKLNPPDDFLFPFKPYLIQKEFMTALFKAIEDKKFGIFESPTGTGKSLSIICGALTWLNNHNLRLKEVIESLISNTENIPPNLEQSDEPVWVVEYAQKQMLDNETNKARALKTIQENAETHRKNARKCNVMSFDKRENHLKRKLKHNEDETLLLLDQAKKDLENYDKGKDCDDNVVDNDEEFVLDIYESDDDVSPVDHSDINADDKDDSLILTKIYFCSRTHSQLSQFIHELQKSPFGQTNVNDEVSGFPISSAILASRKTLCINPAVKRFPTVNQVNEKCLEMQKSKSKSLKEEPKKRKRTSKTCSCPFYSSNSDSLSQLSNKIIGSIMDVEDLVKEGTNLKTCPYYAARRALPWSQLVVLPYQTLLHEPTRLASGIDLRNSVVIIDEAHNLVEALNSMYSCQITDAQIRKAISQLSQYSNKLNKRLKAKNLFYVKQLLFVLRNLHSVFENKNLKTPKDKEYSSGTNIFTLSDFLFQASLDNINFFKLVHYCTKSRIAFKLCGFFEKYDDTNVSSKSSAPLSNLLRVPKREDKQPPATNSPSDDASMTSPLMHIVTFLKSLTSSSSDCRISITTGKEMFLKFLLLSPAQHFKQLLNDCRSIILAGGTMQPSSCLINQLLPREDGDIYQGRIVEFSCDHVIDGSTQLLPIVLNTGPSNYSFNFTFENRKDSTLICELGRMLINAINIIPGGVVCFFPSYDYASHVYERWLNDGTIAKLEIRKKVFCETRQANESENVLNEYTKCIERTTGMPGKLTGAILISVVNGKMSEGINFSDNLGRCVVIVGLPYPNLYAAELKEKISFLDQNLPRHSDGRTAGQVHYENLCMKAVNQSIGRSIRHRNDYACLLLVDNRYGKASVKSKLPNWIEKHVQIAEHFGEAFSAIRKFFTTRKNLEQCGVHKN